MPPPAWAAPRIASEMPRFRFRCPRPARRSTRCTTHASRWSVPWSSSAGISIPGLLSLYLAPQIKRVATDANITGVSFLFDSDFDACRRRLVEQVDKAFPTDDPYRTTEVDVIAVSMGGIVARYAALPAAPGEHRRQLRIARLFTISSPHRAPTSPRARR